jgi:predicted GNAT family N-acyltransferase
MAVTVITIESKSDLKKAFDIRGEVFIEEQKVPREEEYDAYEDESIHFLALEGEEPCGTCRYRFTAEGVKLERFAVLKHFRGKQVGSALMSACLSSIERNNDFKGQPLYLNAQIEAMPLYAKFGFQPAGDTFLECEIVHQKMMKKV